MKKAVVVFQVGFVSFRGGEKRSLAHKCLCNRSYSACYTMNAIICIDLFAFHSEVFNVAA